MNSDKDKNINKKDNYTYLNNSSSWLNTIKGYLFIIPSGLTLFIFIILPVFIAFYISLFQWDLLSEMKFVGLTNYFNLLSSPDFYNTLGNTLYFVSIKLFLDFVLSFFIAVLLNQKIRGLSFYRTLFFTPVVTSMVAVSVVWMWLYDPFYGLFNYILGLFNINPVGWLNNPDWAMFSIILVAVWKGLGYNIVIFLAGLQNIPKSFYEAAAIDGANARQKFRHITIPLLSPTIYFVLIIGIINCFKVFTPVHVMTPDGGPLKSTSVMVFRIYKLAFDKFYFGEASALSVILFLLILAITIFQKVYVEKKVHYYN